jgi:polyhydroxyalkanoate synthesis regulator phasin
VHERRDTHTQPTSRARLVKRLDKLVEAGRVTPEEAARLRAATDSSEFDDTVLEIRLRHARVIVDEAVADGRVSQAEADVLLERLRNREDPSFLRGLRRRVPARDRRRETTRDRGGAHG